MDYFWGFWRKIDHASERARTRRKRTSVLSRNIKPARAQPNQPPGTFSSRCTSSTLSPRSTPRPAAVRVGAGDAGFCPEGYTSEVVTQDDPDAPFIGIFLVQSTRSALNVGLWLRSEAARVAEGQSRPVRQGHRQRAVGIHQLRGVEGIRRPQTVPRLPHMSRPLLQKAFPLKHARSGSTGCWRSFGCCGARTACCLPPRLRRGSPSRRSGCIAGMARWCRSARTVHRKTARRSARHRADYPELRGPPIPSCSGADPSQKRLRYADRGVRKVCCRRSRTALGDGWAGSSGAGAPTCRASILARNRAD